MKINWYIKKFNELSTAEFHDIIQLRLAVFVVEQDCVYQDLDGMPSSDCCNSCFCDFGERLA